MKFGLLGEHLGHSYSPQIHRELMTAGKLNGRQLEYYEEQIHELRMVLKGYTHKDQKATW